MSDQALVTVTGLDCETIQYECSKFASLFDDCSPFSGIGILLKRLNMTHRVGKDDPSKQSSRTDICMN